MIITQTSRIIIRQYQQEEDAPFLKELMNSPKWLQFIGDRNIHTLEDAQNYITDKFFKSYEANGFGYYVIERKEDKIPVGTCGLVNRETIGGIDIGYALLPMYEGNGYAFEATQALYNYAKNTLQIHPILAITLPKNKASVKLLEKLGLTYKKMISFPEENEDLMLFSD